MGDNRTTLLRSLAIDREKSEPSRSRRPFWPILVLALLLAAAATIGSVWLLSPVVFAGRPAAPTTAASPPLPVPDAQAQVSSAKPVLAASGYVVARRKATIAAEITGKVVRVLIEEGMVVEVNQIVAQLDSRLAETDLALTKSRADAAEAAVAMIAADLRDAERVFNRVNALSQKNYASEADFTKAEARLDVLRAQSGQAQAQLQTARLDARRAAEVLDKHQIRAPFAGVVVDRSAQPGEMISPMSAGGSFTRTGICTVVDMDSIEIEVDVNEAYIGRVQKGGAVAAVLDAYPGWTIPAYVIAIVPTANREKATVRVRIGFREKDPRILPDMAVKVTFVEEVSSARASGGE
jgi:HlyD family secretion protein